MKGRRVYPDPQGFLFLEEGDYGFDPIAGHWSARPFGQHTGSLEEHDVMEHEDGTITVSPSILIEGETRWHGYLEAGVWREV